MRLQSNRGNSESEKEGMNSLGNDCNELKRQYDACFNIWFSNHFLLGQTDETMCSPVFKIYQDCVKKAMREQKVESSEIEADYTIGDYEHAYTGTQHSKG